MVRTTGVFLSTLAMVLVTVGLALADPAPPTASVLAEIVEYGIYCKPKEAGRVDAPDTALGYINLFEGEFDFRFHQQQVPAQLGMSFGLIIRPAIDVPVARMETYKPGTTAPEVWYTDLHAGEPKTRGFSFDFPEELILGTWRMEGWDGDTRLYSIEFQVVPPSALPGIGPDCNLLS